MRTIDDDRKIHSAMDVVRELSTTPKTIVDTASRLNLNFLIKTPEDTEIYLRDSYKKRLVRRWGDTAKVFDFNRDKRTLLITSDANYLGIEPSEYKPIIPMGLIQVKEFNSIAKISTNFEITILDTASYISLNPEGKFDETFNGTFDSFHETKSTPLMEPGKPTQEKTITVVFNDLFITTENLWAIRKNLSIKEPTYGKFKKGEWTSTMLAHLNEASTLFFASPKPNSTSSETVKEIETWLRARWGEHAGGPLVNEAAKAILPDTENESEIKISDEILEISNDYASTTLTKINEAAFYNWREMKSKYGKYRQDKALTQLLNEKYKFKGRLIKAVSTIIRPDENKRIKITSPY